MDPVSETSAISAEAARSPILRSPAGGGWSKSFARLGRVTKRVRGAARVHRPGTRPPSERTGRRLAGDVERPSQLEAATEIAEPVVDERPMRTDTVERAQRPVAAHPRHRPKPGSLLAERAASEYVYVAQDMRRILVVSAVLVAVLIVLWVLIVVMKAIPLAFY